MKVICVLGVGCVGKSIYCRKLLKNYVSAGRPRPVLLQLGAFFRATLGPDFFTKLDCPTAPVEIEPWVKNCVHNAMSLAWNNSVKNKVDTDMILDGFPRTKEQLQWLMLSSWVSKHSIDVEVHILYTDEVELEIRQRKRISENPDESKLMAERIKSDYSLFTTMNEELNFCCSNYPRFSIKERMV